MRCVEVRMDNRSGRQHHQPLTQNFSATKPLPIWPENWGSAKFCWKIEEQFQVTSSNVQIDIFPKGLDREGGSTLLPDQFCLEPIEAKEWPDLIRITDQLHASWQIRKTEWIILKFPERMWIMKGFSLWWIIIDDPSKIDQSALNQVNPSKFKWFTLDHADDTSQISPLSNFWRSIEYQSSQGANRNGTTIFSICLRTEQIWIFKKSICSAGRWIKKLIRPVKQIFLDRSPGSIHFPDNPNITGYQWFDISFYSGFVQNATFTFQSK